MNDGRNPRETISRLGSERKRGEAFYFSDGGAPGVDLEERSDTLALEG
jgi:hypothetical protein